jgi:hypothetical protein
MQTQASSQLAKMMTKSFRLDLEVIRKFVLPAVVFISSFVLYWSTAARHPGWVDATLILSAVRNLNLGVWANIHNLFNLLGYAWLHIFPGVDPHFSLTVLCSLLGSLTVVFIYQAGVELTENPFASVLASIALALSLSLWWHSTTIEVYTLNTTLIALFLCFVFRSYRRANPRGLYLAFFFGGLGISNHVLMGLYVFAFLAVLLPFAVRDFHLKAQHIAALIACYLAGASLFATLFILQWYGIYRNMAAGTTEGTLLLATRSLGASLRFATGGHFLKSMFTAGLSLQEKLFWRGNYLFLIALNYPSTAMIFIVAGFPRLWKRSAFRGAIVFFLIGIAAQIIWSANYFIWDMYAFALPVYVMLGIPLAAGIDGFLKKNRYPNFRWLIFLTLLIPAVLYPSFSHWPNREKSIDRYIALYPEAERTGGIWDPAEYIFNPIKRNYTDVVAFSEGVLDTLPQGAAYWDDESKAAYPIEFYYQEVKGQRRDVKTNRVFGLVMEEADARRYAKRMLAQLRRGEQVFVSGLVEPEREILNQLYHMLAPTTPMKDIHSQDLNDFRSSFPDFEIVDTPIVPDGSLRIYELRRRNPGQ